MPTKSKLFKKEPIYKFRVTVTLDELRNLVIKRLRTKLKTIRKDEFQYWDTERICQSLKPNIASGRLGSLAARIRSDATRKRQITEVLIPYTERIDHLKLGRTNKR